MKTNALFFLFVLNFSFLSAQIASPTGQRGMYVDCVDELILDVVQNSNDATNSTLATELITYASNNFFTYIACYRLDHSSIAPNGYIVGDPQFDLAIKSFIQYAHANDISVGFVVSGTTYLDNIFQTSNFYFPIDHHWKCIDDVPYPEPTAEYINPSDEAQPNEIMRSELYKSCLRAQTYSFRISNGYQSSPNGMNQYSWDFDWVSVEFEYWSASTFDAVDPSGQDIYPHNDPYKVAQLFCYEDYISLSQTLKWLQYRSCYNFSIETELSIRDPKIDQTGQNRLIAPSADDQAAEIDIYYDRILLIDYHPLPTALFLYQCSDITRLSLSGTKPGTVIWPLVSAESNQFLKACWGNQIFDDQGLAIHWNPYLGDHLLTPNSLYSAEIQHYNDVINGQNNGVYCPYCNCTFGYNDSEIGGYMWFTYSVLNDIFNGHVFNRKSNSKTENIETYFSFYDDKLVYHKSDYIGKISIVILDIMGNEIFTWNKNIIEDFQIGIPQFSSGIYFVKLLDERNNQKVIKIYIQ